MPLFRDAGMGRRASRKPFDELTASFDRLTMLSPVEAVSNVELS